MLIHSVAQELDCRGGEDTLGGIYLQTILLQDSEELPQMVQMLLQGAAGDDVVIQVGEDEGEVAEELVHEPLKSLRCVPKAKRHKKIFEKTKRSYYSSFLNIFLSHRDLMIALDEVDAREEPAAVELVGEVQDAGQGVAVVDGGEVEAAIVSAGPPGSILLAYHVQRGGPWGVGSANDARRLQLAEFRLGCAKFVRVQPPCLSKDRPAFGLHCVAYTMARCRRPLTISHDGRERSQKGADRGGDAAERGGELGAGRGRGGGAVADGLECLGVKNQAGDWVNQ
jgi:hypothetical protein